MTSDTDHTDRRHDTTPDPAEILERALEHVPPAERHRAREALEALTDDAEDARKVNEAAMQMSTALNDVSIELLAARRDRDELREQVRAEQARRRDAEARLQMAQEALAIADDIAAWAGSYSSQLRQVRRYRRARRAPERMEGGGDAD